jgi:hypothetical protein
MLTLFQQITTKQSGPEDFLCIWGFFSLFFCNIGVWTQDFSLARQAFYHLSHVSSSVNLLRTTSKEWYTWREEVIEYHLLKDCLF